MRIFTIIAAFCLMCAASARADMPEPRYTALALFGLAAIGLIARRKFARP